MKLDLTKLTEAVSKVAGIAAENAQLKQDMTDGQAAVDALTASLIAATTSPFSRKRRKRCVASHQI